MFTSTISGGDTLPPIGRNGLSRNTNDVYYANSSLDGVVPDMSDELGSVELKSYSGDSPKMSAQPKKDIPAADDLSATLDGLSDSIKEAMKKIPTIENQVGAIFITENQVKGMDIYDLPDSWQSVKDDIVEKEGSAFLKKEENNLFEFKPEKIKGLLGKELSKKFSEKIIYGEAQGEPYKIIEFREEKDEKDSSKTRLIGEVVEFNGKIIHLTLYRV
jgi:hypothetical protein